jgi:hypothetical protein
MLLNPPTSTNSDVAEFEKFILGFSETDLEVPESEELLQATMESYGVSHVHNVS